MGWCERAIWAQGGEIGRTAAIECSALMQAWSTLKWAAAFLGINLP
jgi:hypothetical protein